MKFMVFSKDACPYCESAKVLLKQKGHEYIENKLGKDYTREEFVEMFPTVRTFPHIVLMNENGNQTIGGFNELRNWFATQGLSI